jgi:hypothetical protein
MYYKWILPYAYTHAGKFAIWQLFTQWNDWQKNKTLFEIRDPGNNESDVIKICTHLI